MQRLTLVVGAALVICGMTWALWPIRIPSVGALPAQSSVTSELVPNAPSLIDPNVFAANLWRSPPQLPDADTATEVKTEPPKPMNLHLIGIIYENGVRRAALYDIEADRLLILRDGDHICGNTIKSISDKAVELSDGRITRQLTLIQLPDSRGNHS